MFDIRTAQWVIWGAKRPYNTFGHIHEAYGQQKVGETLYVNASSCTLQYRPIQKPVVVEL